MNTEDQVPITTISREQAIEAGQRRYFTGLPCKNRHVAQRDLTGKCLACKAAQWEAIYNSPEKRDARNAASRKYHTHWRHTRPASYLLNRAMERGRRYRLECTISERDIIVPTHCPICGVLMVIGKGAAHKASPTLDRVDSEKGYIPGNVAVICSHCNTIKSTGTADRHRAIADWMDAHIAAQDLAKATP